ncbi:MAG: DNA methyltransferase [Aestuariivita sp.]|nr:DNA methyltransferase [Aestuariivita sp.]
MNRLFYGDCLTIMQEMKLGSVDLIYLDPPFNSNRDYNNIYTDETGRPLPDQVEAFCDTWTLDIETERAARHMPVLMREAGVDDAIAEFWRHWLNALRKSNPKVLAYLVYMTQRLLPMRGILKPTGSVYLHCDPTASHYVKVMMDAIFGHDNFRNEIVWCYKSRPQPKSKFGQKHDVILLYGNSKSAKFNWRAVARPLSESTVKKYRLKDDDGRLYRLQGRGITDSPIRSQKDVPLHWEADHPDLVVRDYLDEKDGTTQEDWWTDIPILNQNSTERLGYATQKPVELLERIILASSNLGDVVLDPFCGCATTIEAAHKLRRRWIGIDIAIHAIKRVASVRLRDRLGLIEGKDFTVEGVPRNVEGARDLWERDKYHFQKWAVEQVDGFVTTKKGTDGGVDGRLYFDLQSQPDLQSMVIEVKGGRNVGINVIRDLRGVLERDTAKMAGLIILNDLGDRKTRNFNIEMAQAGDLEVAGVKYARMQMLTVQEIIDGKRFFTPSVARGRGQAQPVLPF